jgi:fructosamine-3-kinase
LSNVLSLPGHPNEITPAWLTKILRTSGAIEQARVVSVRVEQIGTFSSELLRLRLTYDRLETGAPTSLILKQMIPNPVERPEEGFANEIRFYRDVARLLAVRIPQLYFADVDDATGEALLVLEDVEGLVPIDWQSGVTTAHVKLALASLAQLHANWWGRTDGLEGLPHLDDPDFWDKIGEAYDRGWQTSRDYFQEAYGQSFVAIGDALVGRVAETLAPLGAPATLLHGDAHFENLPVMKEEDDNRILFFDWAAARRGLASFDVAVFAVQSFPIEKRRQAEEALVAAHAAAVKAAGVTEWPDPWLDYRRGVLAWMVHMIQNATLRPGDPSWVVVERYAAAAVDLRVGELIH